MMIESTIEAVVYNPSVALYGVLGLIILIFLFQGITNPLAKVPGPEISKWTDAVYWYYWLRGEILPYIHSLHQQYGPIVRINTFQVDINDHHSAKEIHKTHSPFVKGKLYRMFISNNIENIFSTADQQFHASRRRLLASAMSDSSLTRHEPLVHMKASMAVDGITRELKARGVSDVFKWWLFLATDVIGELSFGESFQMLEAGEKNQYSMDLEQISAILPFRVVFPNLIKMGRYLPIPFFNKVAASGKRLAMYPRKRIERYKQILAEHPENLKPTLFTKVFDAEKSGMTETDIQHEAQGYIVAGSDTTAVSLTYLTYSVCRDTRIRDKLVVELGKLPEGFTDKDLRNLPYLNHVIDETLRLYSAAPGGLPRVVPPEGAQFNGYYIKGGLTVSTSAYCLHRVAGVYPDPESFKPERWENTTKAMKESWMPFGGGSRICIGMHLARMELRLATTLFFRAFPRSHISTKEGMTEDDMHIKASFLMGPQGHRCLIEA